MKKILALLSFCLPAYIAAAHTDTVRVYFATAKSEIAPGVQEQLAGYIYNDVLQSRQTIQIVGYADYVGGNRSNDQLSKRRANAVKRFLMQYGFQEKNITICIGKGEVERDMKGNDGFARDRRVDIVINPPVTSPEEVPAPSAPVPAPKPVAEKKAPAPKSAQAIQKDITTLKKGETLVLNNIYFYPGRHMVKPESAAALNSLYEILDENPGVNIGIEGHVCCVKGSASDALDFDTREIALSVNRAKAIYNYLVKKGIDKDRLSFKGFGASRRVVQEENTEEDADKNRRVEIRIE